MDAAATELVLALTQMCDARLLGNELASLPSVQAGDEQRASRLIALNGLDEREKCEIGESFAVALRPSGPNARICGEEPRCPYWIIVNFEIFDMNMKMAEMRLLIVSLVYYLSYFD